MALVAAERALAAAGTKPQDIDLIAVTAIHRHGHQRLWSPASWLQSRLGATRALPFTVAQGCNAQLLVLDLAADLLSAEGRRTALIVATDRFAASGFDRFTADYGIVYGDGAAAAVLTADTPAPEAPTWHVLDTHSVSDPELEGLHRLDEPAPETRALFGAEHDVRAAKKRYLAAHGTDSLREATRRAVREIRETLLPHGTDPALRRVVYPNLGLPCSRRTTSPNSPAAPGHPCGNSAPPSATSAAATRSPASTTSNATTPSTPATGSSCWAPEPDSPGQECSWNAADRPDDDAHASRTAHHPRKQVPHVTTAPSQLEQDLAALELSYSRTVDRTLVHRDSLGEVFLTDLQPLGTASYVAAAQLPRSHAYYGDHLLSPNVYDPVLLLEACRRAHSPAPTPTSRCPGRTSSSSPTCASTSHAPTG